MDFVFAGLNPNIII